MNYFSPLTKQIFVASSPQLAALSVGGIFGYANVLLEQFKADDSSIQLDLDIGSWIGSVHGLAGLPSILMPTVMQWRGRKFAFNICCLLIITGWILAYVASNVTTIIISESIHGLGSNSLMIVSFFKISEMIDPKFRNISMNFYCVNQGVGTAIVSIMGRFIHWRTVSLVMSVPVVVALLIGCVGPESPSWLAWKGDFDRCEQAFIWLRGTSEDSNKELNALINAQKHIKHAMFRRNKSKERSLINLWLKIKRKDFYLPCSQMFVCLSLFYCSGTVAVIIYAMDMIRKATENETAAFYGMIVIDVLLVFGTIVSVFFMKMFRNKPILLFSGSAAAICMFFASLVTFLQRVGSLPKDSLLCMYCLMGFVIACSSGMISLSLSISAELIPVKHRDLGGALYAILTGLLHFFSLKVSPYMLFYLDLWGTFLIFALNAFFCILYISKYVPETKNRTLQEIEDYYNHGRFLNRYNGSDVEDNVPMSEVEDK